MLDTKTEQFASLIVITNFYVTIFDYVHGHWRLCSVGLLEDEEHVRFDHAEMRLPFAIIREYE